MIKKYCKYMVITLVALFASITNGFAKEMTLEEVNDAVIAEEPYAGYYYNIGQYVFTSSHILTLEDIMLAARTIAVSSASGGSDKDAIYKEMATYQFNAIWGEETVESYEYKSNFTGDSAPGETLDVCYINYKNICGEESVRTPENSVGIPLELDGEELNTKIIEKEPYAGYFYNIGQYVFTSSHILTLEDMMLAARTIEVSTNAGATDEDLIFEEMATHQFNAIWGDETVENFEYSNNFTGTSKPKTAFNICYINYEKICSDSILVDTDALIEDVYEAIKTGLSTDKYETTVDDDNNLNVTIVDTSLSATDVFEAVDIIENAKKLLAEEGVKSVTLTYGTAELVLSNDGFNVDDEYNFIAAIMDGATTSTDLDGKTIAAKIAYEDGYATENSNSFGVVLDVKTSATVSVELADEVKVGKTSEFTVTTKANDYKDKKVLLVFDAENATIEYKDGETWTKVETEFGGEGFALVDSTYQFRATWSSTGNQAVTVKVVDATSKDIVYATATDTINVLELVDATVSTTIANAKVDSLREFDVVTVANDYVGKSVLVTFEVTDKTAISEFKYYNGTEWVDISDDLRTTTVQLADAIHKFQVTWSKVGDQTVTIKVVDATSNKVYASTEQTITIADVEPATTEMTIDETGEVGVAQEFTVKTTANDYENKNVIGMFEFVDEEAVEKLEYYNNNTWSEITTTFGDTGFALTTTTYQFRITWAKAGTQKFKLNIVDANDNSKDYASTSEATVTVAKGTVTVSDQSSLISALGNENYDTIVLESDIETTLPIVLTNDVTIVGNGNTLKAEYTNGAKTFIITSGNVTMDNVVIDANNKGRGVAATAGTLTVKNSSIINGQSVDYASGLMMTGSSTLVFENSIVTGNKVSDKYAEDGYLQYSSDLWIGSESTGTIKSGEIGNAFVNGNESGPGGDLTVDGGTIDTVYVEYEPSSIGELIYNAGEITNLYVSTVDGSGDAIYTSEPEYDTYLGGVPVATIAQVATEDGLKEALLDEDITEIILTSDVVLEEPVVLTKDITITGNNYKLEVDENYTVPEGSKALITLSGDVEVTLDGVKVDAGSKTTAIYSSATNLVLNNSTVTDGHDGFGAGVFITGKGNVEITNSTISGNTNGIYKEVDCTKDGYLQYSSDLWIGSEATGTINSGTIGNAFVNENPSGDGGTLTVTGGEIENIYLEYEDGIAATLIYEAGEITNLHISTTTTGTANTVVNPDKGTYKSGVEVATTTVVATEAQLQEALANEDITEIILTDNVTLTTPLVLTKAITITGNDYQLVADENYTVPEGSKALITLSGDVEVTLDGVKVDAESKTTAIYSSATNLVLNNSTVTGGHDGFGAGVFITGKGNVEITNSTISGNTNGIYKEVDRTKDGYLQYSSDLWIGSEATGTINSGTVDNVFVNENPSGDGGTLTVTGGEIENIYLEYEDGIAATLIYEAGEITNLYVSTTTTGTSELIPTPSYGTYISGVLPVNEVTTEEDLITTLANSEVEEITLANDITVTSPLTIDNDVTIVGNGNTIVAGETPVVFNLLGSDGTTFGTFITINNGANVTFDNVNIDGNKLGRVIKVENSNFTLKDSTITGGLAEEYVAGVYVTKASTIEIIDSTISGNTNGVGYTEDGYLQYSSDLWIASDATGIITSGTIGNVFVNDNEYGTGGILTVNDGKIENVYLEYQDGAYSTLNYVGGTVTNLHISTLDGNGAAITIENPEYDTYISGVEVATTIEVATETQLQEALLAEDIVEIVLTDNVTLTTPLVLTKSITITGNDYQLVADENYTVPESSKALITLSGDVEVILDGVTVDAGSKTTAIYSSAANLVLNNSTVTGGHDGFGAGVFITGKGNVEITNSTISGNTNGVYEEVDRTKDGYLQYSSDLWIGSEATGTINSGTVDNVFVNDNAYGDGGILTVNGGTIKNIYLEYEDGAYSMLNYVDGTIENLYVSTTTTGKANKVETITKDTTYKAGQVY